MSGRKRIQNNSQSGSRSPHRRLLSPSAQPGAIHHPNRYSQPIASRSLPGFLVFLLIAGAPLSCGDDGFSEKIPPQDATVPDIVPSPSDALFDSLEVRTYSLEVSASDWDQLNADPRAEEYVPATLTFEGSQYSDVAIRYKGAFSTLRNCFDEQGNRRCDKLSMKLKFSEYDPKKRFFGLKRLNFNSYIKDPSFVREKLAYSLFDDMGIATPRASYARLVINGNDLGVFGLVEQVDGPFVRRHFQSDDGGNLYKEVWPVHTTQDIYFEALKTNRDKMPTVNRIVTMAEELRYATPQTFVDTLGSWVDLNVLMTYIAVDRAIDHADGPLTFYCWSGGHFNHNYYWYEHPIKAKMQLIPWDFGQSFQFPNPLREIGVPEWNELPPATAPCPTYLDDAIAHPGCDPIVSGISTLLRDQFRERAQAVLDGPFSIDAMSEKLDRWTTQLASEIATDPSIDQEIWANALADLRANLPMFRQRLQNEITKLSSPL